MELNASVKFNGDLCPAVMYPKVRLEEIGEIIEEHKNNPTAAFESVEDMFKALDIDLSQ